MVIYISMLTDQALYWIIAAAAVALVYGSFLTLVVLRTPAGDKKMQEIAKAIQEGAASYLARQYSVVAIVGFVVALILWWKLGLVVGISFVIGATASALAGFIGMNVAVKANVRTKNQRKKG